MPGPPITLRCRAILFDMDGVLVDSRECIELIWRRWAADRGRDPEPFLRAAHGRRTVETVRLAAPEMDAVAEAVVLDAMEETETRGVVAAAGASGLLERLRDNQWAVVTSANRKVAALRLRTANIPTPRVLITSEDVARGKPHPEGYRLAAARLGVLPHQCVVVEDSPVGVEAGKATGSRVVAVLLNYPATALANADACAATLADLRLQSADEGDGWLVIEV